MQTLTIKSVQTKTSRNDPTKHFYVVTDSSGADFTTFDAEVVKLLPGAVIEAEIKVEGRYKNLEGFTVTKQGAAEPPPLEEKRAAPLDNGREVSMAVSYIKDLMVAKIMPVEHALAVLAMSWCASRIVAAGVTPHGIFADDPSKETGEAPKVATGAAPAQDKSIKQEAVSPVEQGKTVIKTAADLWRWAQDKGLTIADIRQVLGHVGPTSSKDLTGEYTKLLAEIKKRHEEAK